MPPLLPIYEEHGRKYQADACEPVVRAARSGEARLVTLARGQYPGRRLPRGGLVGVKTIGYWDADHDQTWGLPLHRNEGIELTFLERGHLDFVADGQAYRLQPDDLTVTRPWQQHQVGDPNVAAGRLHWLILDVGVRRPDQPWRWPPWLVLTREDRQQLTHILRHNEQPVWPATAEIRRSFHQIGVAVEQGQSGGSLSRLAVRLNELLLLILEMFRHRRVPLDESLSATRRSVQLFLADLRQTPAHLAEEWTLRRMAASCGLGTTRFVSYTKQLTNMTPNQYLNHCRLETAARLLKEQPDLSITQVALACGFSSGQYFSTAFRRQHRCTPRAYRAERRLGELRQGPAGE